MKRMKKLASLLLAMVMVLSMTVAAFAEDEETKKDSNTTFTITVNDSRTTHVYTAYQIFKGDLYVENKNESNEKKTLSNIEWGNGVNQTGLIAALKEMSYKTTENGNEVTKQPFSALSDTATAVEVADILKNAEKDSAFAQAFAKVIGTKLGTSAGTSTYNDNTKNHTITGLKAGYYLVSDGGTIGAEGDAYSRYIMQVVANVTAEVKVSTPTVDKKIVTGANDSDRADANNAGIGQVVTYEITGLVPDYQSYDKYFYVITDTLSKGLTFNNDVTVTVDNTTLTQITKNEEGEWSETGNYYLYVEKLNDEKTQFQIAFKNIKDYETGKSVKVNYSATVNDDAITGAAGNPNTVSLTYSNNPNSEQKGENGNKPGTPDSNVPTGKSPDEKTITYVAEIDITKYAEDANGDKGEVLPGATFTLTGTSNQVVLSTKTYYVESTSGDANYYLLKDGTYTTEVPQAEEKDNNGNVITESNEDSYVSTTVKYEKKIATETKSYPTSVKMIVTSDERGKVIFKSLGTGTYEIEETGVPAGYNKAENITVQIDCTVPEKITTGNETAKWSVGASTTKTEVIENGVSTMKDVASVADETIGIYTLEIINKAGSILPSTGGIGRTIFYAAGIILMAGAMFFVVRRKRA